MASASPARRSVQDPAPADEELIEEFLRSGDVGAFGELVARHQDRVFRLVASVLGPGSAPEAEDLTQEIFLEVCGKLHTFRRESRLSTWLHRLAWRRAIDRKRLARLRFVHFGEEALADRSPHPDETDPAAAAIDRQRRQRLRAAVRELAEPYRTTVYLYYWMERPVAEIAELLGCRPGTVKAHLFRARKQLERKLGPLGGDLSKEHDENGQP